MRIARLSVLIWCCLVIGLACTPRYRLPQTEPMSRASVTTAEHAYKVLYLESQAQRLSPGAMVQVDDLYRTWRATQQLLVDAVRAGAIEWTPE